MEIKIFPITFWWHHCSLWLDALVMLCASKWIRRMILHGITHTTSAFYRRRQTPCKRSKGRLLWWRSKNWIHKEMRGFFQTVILCSTADMSENRDSAGESEWLISLCYSCNHGNYYLIIGMCRTGITPGYNVIDRWKCGPVIFVLYILLDVFISVDEHKNPKRQLSVAWSAFAYRQEKGAGGKRRSLSDSYLFVERKEWMHQRGIKVSGVLQWSYTL